MLIESHRGGLSTIGALLVISILFLLFGFGSLPESGNLAPPPWDKAVHVAVFATLAIGLKLLMPGQRWFVLFFLAAAIAMLDEAHQFLVPNRHPACDDGIADLAGIGLGLYVWRRVASR